MIILYHNTKTIIEISGVDAAKVPIYTKQSIARGLIEVAKAYPDELLVWCSIALKNQLRLSLIPFLFENDTCLFSYHPGPNHFLNDAIGYVEQSPFIKVNKAVAYPTWQLSSVVGAVKAKVIHALANEIPHDRNFDYFLNSLAKLAQPLGLFCYSEPRLLLSTAFLEQKNTNYYVLFRFVKQHYKWLWVFLLFFNLMVYEKKVKLLPLLYSLCFRKRVLQTDFFQDYFQQINKISAPLPSIDVLIPTIGRKAYLYDVLNDLNQQTHLPKNVIIVEQNPEPQSKSELDYIKSEPWNFTIKHIFTHQPGACNARNLALNQVVSDWVFFADDDIRLKDEFLHTALQKMIFFKHTSVSFYCGSTFEKTNDTSAQWLGFGSGSSIVRLKSATNLRFNKAFEFGFGEDSDFGMQLRNQGIDVVYYSNPQIQHLKAPMGGFRTKPKVLWDKELIEPKPSPTVMLYTILHTTEFQRNGYKTLLFIKFYFRQNIKNPFTYISLMQKKWLVSYKWAIYLKENL